MLPQEKVDDRPAPHAGAGPPSRPRSRGLLEPVGPGRRGRRPGRSPAAAAGKAAGRGAAVRRDHQQVVGAVGQVSGRHDLGLGPGRQATCGQPPLPLIVLLAAPALIAAVDLHVSGVYAGAVVEPAGGQRRQPAARGRVSDSIRLVTRPRPDYHHLPTAKNLDPPGQARPRGWINASPAPG